MKDPVASARSDVPAPGRALRLEDALAENPTGVGVREDDGRIVIVIASGFLGSLVAAPVFDLAARSICSTYAADEGLVLIDAHGGPHSVPAYSCRFKDAQGTTVIVDENDHLVELAYRHRGYSLGGFFAWGSSSSLASDCASP